MWVKYRGREGRKGQKWDWGYKRERQGKGRDRVAYSLICSSPFGVVGLLSV